MLILIGILVFSAFLYRKSLRLEGAAETNQDLSVRAYVDGKRVTSYVKDSVSCRINFPGRLRPPFFDCPCGFGSAP